MIGDQSTQCSNHSPISCHLYYCTDAGVFPPLHGDNTREKQGRAYLDDAWVRTGTLLWKLEHVERVQVRPGIKRRNGISMLHGKSKRPLERRGSPDLLKSQFQLTSKCRGEKPTIQG